MRSPCGTSDYLKIFDEEHQQNAASYKNPLHVHLKEALFSLFFFFLDDLKGAVLGCLKMGMEKMVSSIILH